MYSAYKTAGIARAYAPIIDANKTALGTAPTNPAGGIGIGDRSVIGTNQPPFDTTIACDTHSAACVTRVDGRRKGIGANQAANGASSTDSTTGVRVGYRSIICTDQTSRRCQPGHTGLRVAGADAGAIGIDPNQTAHLLAGN